MSAEFVEELRRSCTGEVRPGAALAAHTTLRVGGPARVLVVAERDEDLASAGRVAAQHRLPCVVVGRGSNLLVADSGWPGIAIQLGRGYRGLETDGAMVRAGAAEPLPVLAVRLADAGYAGFAWACAVPGTLGGAVRMNAGAHGSDMGRHLVEVELVRLGTGAREVWPVDALGLGYRRSTLPEDAVVVAGTLRLARGDAAAIREEIAGIRAWRRANQPLNEPNCGSVFTNPPDDSAGRLLEAAGAKGMRVGCAAVSDRHANFIVTRPGASAADVANLIGRLQALVRDRAGVELVPEVTRIGDFGGQDQDAGAEAVTG